MLGRVSRGFMTFLWGEGWARSQKPGASTRLTNRQVAAFIQAQLQ